MVTARRKARTARSAGDPLADYRRPPDAVSGGEAPAGDTGPRRRFRPWRVLRIASGFLLLVVGVIGLFLPILQGVLMILAGLAVLGKDLPWSRAITDRLAGFVRKRASRGGKAEKAANRPETS